MEHHGPAVHPKPAARPDPGDTGLAVVVVTGKGEVPGQQEEDLVGDPGAVMVPVGGYAPSVWSTPRLSTIKTWIASVVSSLIGRKLNLPARPECVPSTRDC